MSRPTDTRTPRVPAAMPRKDADGMTAVQRLTARRVERERLAAAAGGTPAPAVAPRPRNPERPAATPRSGVSGPTAATPRQRVDGSTPAFPQRPAAGRAPSLRERADHTLTTAAETARRPTTSPPAKMGTDEYVLFCEGIRALSKIDLLQYKRGQMERRIRTFVTRRGHTALDTYLPVLQSDPAELELFFDRVTINVSQLWRNPEQWTLLAAEILPALAAEGDRVRIWSAGSSYGAEAYTLAATAREAIGSTKVEVSGTDIDPRMVERARLGHFSHEDARSAPESAMRRHFTEDADGWQAKRELVSMCRFDVGDLLRVSPAPGAYDLVLCRNTVIYFNEDVRDALHARLVESLRPGGFLMVGSTERIADAKGLGLAASHPFTYRKLP